MSEGVQILFQMFYYSLFVAQNTSQSKFQMPAAGIREAGHKHPQTRAHHTRRGFKISWRVCKILPVINVGV